MSYGSMMAVTHSRGNERDGNRSGGNEMRHRGGEYYPNANSATRYEANEMRYDAGGYSGGNEMAFRDRTGRRHYGNGRFAPMRNEMMGGDDDDEERGIGFVRGGEYPRAGWEMTHRDQGREMGRASVYETKGGYVVQGQFGGKSGRESGPMDETMAEEWTRRMKNDDGSTGAHWQMEQIKQLQQQKKELQDHEPAEVFAVMNMMHSDYCEVAKKFGVNNMDFYVALTKAWLNDPDAKKNKTARYYECVVK